MIAADLDYAIPIDEDPLSSGPGFGIRAGKQLDVPGLVLTPELGFTYVSFDGDAKVYRGLAGLRLGVGEVLRPGVFAHAGIGHLDEPSHTAFTFDGGVFLDFTLIPLVNIGVHGAYNHLSGGDVEALHWATVGAHAALVF